jgi:hypothetical protein
MMEINMDMLSLTTYTDGESRESRDRVKVIGIGYCAHKGTQ